MSSGNGAQLPADGFDDSATRSAVRALAESYRDAFEQIDVLRLGQHFVPRATGYLARRFKTIRDLTREAEDAALRRGEREGAGFEEGFGGRREGRRGDGGRVLSETNLLQELRKERSRVLILGDGGNGKSEYTRQLAYELADGLMKGDSSIVPLRVELSQLGGIDRRKKRLGDQLVDRIFENHADVRPLLASGRLLLILDGLDEIPFADKDFDDAFAMAVQHGELQHCRILLAGRSSGLRPGVSGLFKDLYQVQPQSLTDAEIASYVRAFFAADGRTPAQGEALIRAIEGASPGTKTLLGWPLMLSLACIEWRRNPGELAENPADLMDGCLSALLIRRNEDAPESERIDPDEAIDALSRLARGMCPRFDRIRRSDLESHRIKSATVDRLVRRSGLLFGDAGRGYQFSIKPLAEYLAGRALAAEAVAEPAKVAQHFGDHVWQGEWTQPYYWMIARLLGQEAAAGVGEISHDGNSEPAIARKFGGAAGFVHHLLQALSQAQDDVFESLTTRLLQLLSAVPERACRRGCRDWAGLVEWLGAHVDRIRQHGGFVRGLPDALRKRISARWARVLNDLDQNEDVRRDAAEALGKIGHADAIEPLIECLKHDQIEGARASATEALGQIGYPDAIKPLIECLKPDQSEDVRRYAAIALGNSGHADAIPPLVEILTRERLPSIRMFAAEALIQLGKMIALSLTNDRVEQNQSDMFSTCTAALAGNIGHADAISPLIKCLKPDQIEDVRRYAAWALGNIGHADAIPPLVKCLKDDLSEHVRRDVAEALGKIGDRRAAESLLSEGREHLAAASHVRRVPQRHLIRVGAAPFDDSAAVPPVAAGTRRAKPDLRDTLAFVRKADDCDPLVRVTRENRQTGATEIVTYLAAVAAALRVVVPPLAKQSQAGAAGGSHAPKSAAAAPKKTRNRKPRTELTTKQQAVWEWVHRQKLSYKAAALVYKSEFGKSVSWQNIKNLYDAACEVLERRGVSVNTRRPVRDDE